jgi:predicted N-acetyltransferase YhbS
MLEVSAEQERRSLETFTSDQRKQVALIAKRDGIPVGTCLLVPSEIDPNHSLTPWLAGLLVAPEHRRQGAGEILVRSIEEQARKRGFSRLYLYSDDAIGYYERFGWHVVDRTNWKGFDTALMAHDL